MVEVEDKEEEEVEGLEEEKNTGLIGGVSSVALVTSVAERDLGVDFGKGIALL